MSVGKMFERRELTRVLTVPPKYMQRNIQSSLLSQLKGQIEGRCGIEGYVQPKTSVILEYSLGSCSILRPGVTYEVRFQADICYPRKGQVLRVPVIFRSKIGVHAEQSPLRVLLPRDLHIGNSDFEAIQEKDEVEFEVLGAEFKQNDEQVFVLGKLIKRIPAAVEEGKTEAVIPMMDEVATGPAPSTEGVKTVTIQESATVAPAAKEPVRRKKKLGSAASSSLEGPTTLQLNVSREAPASS
jgi:DNA-directed RNA polymerase subunit E'/Rpb7